MQSQINLRGIGEAIDKVTNYDSSMAITWHWITIPLYQAIPTQFL